MHKKTNYILKIDIKELCFRLHIDQTEKSEIKVLKWKYAMQIKIFKCNIQEKNFII
jgi:hypothetical protein